MEPESEYLKIKALWDRFIASLPPEDGRIRRADEYSAEFHETTKQMEREHITHVGYMVGYAERLLAKIEELEG